MKLYFSPTSPYVRKVRISALELGLGDRLQLAPIDVLPTTINLDYARQNPLMKIPALVTDDVGVLYDSVVICEYLDTLAGGTLFPRAGAARWRALRLQALGDGMLDASISARYEGYLRPEPLRWGTWISAQLAKVDNALDLLEADCPPSSAQALDIGMVCVGCALGYLDFRFADRAWRTSRPRLAAWFAELSQRESVRSTAPR